MAAASLTGLWWLYALIVTPRMVPAMSADARQPSVTAEHLQAEPQPGNMEDAKRYLADAPWAARAKFQIRLANSVLYSESWRPKDDSEEIFEFSPFAMILFDDQNGDNHEAVAEPRQ